MNVLCVGVVDQAFCCHPLTCTDVLLRTQVHSGHGHGSCVLDFAFSVHCAVSIDVACPLHCMALVCR